MAAEPLILVSNRGPVTFGRRRGVGRTAERGGGGLVTALLGLVDHTPALWISAAISEEDARVAEEADGRSFPLPDVGLATRGRFVVLDDDTFHAFYNVIANPMLWFIQHYLWDLSNAPDVRIEELEAAEAIRAAHPDAFLHFFVHIPWPQPDYWRVLPPTIREPIVSGLLANDIIAFHTPRYARNFLLSCEDLLDLRVDYQRRVVRHEGRDVWVRSYPISVNEAAFLELGRSPEVAAEEGPILRRRRRHMVLRVDRTDLSKNILRGFKAFDIFLDRHPEFLEHITFLALVQPSRQDVDEYVEYVAKIRELVSYINTKHGNTDWMPIDLRIESNLHRAVAAYKHYDVIMVNSIFDGMNLVAKEAALLNERDGALILSENVGAHEEIGSFALSVNPFDIESQVQALHQALTMSPEERAARAHQIRAIVRENNVVKWLAAQMADIHRKRATRRRREART